MLRHHPALEFRQTNKKGQIDRSIHWVVYEEIEYDATAVLLDKIAKIESGITSGIEDLKGLLS